MTDQSSGRNCSMPMLMIASAGFGIVRIPVVDKISWNALFQRLVMLGHVHKGV